MPSLLRFLTTFFLCLSLGLASSWAGVFSRLVGEGATRAMTRKVGSNAAKTIARAGRFRPRSLALPDSDQVARRLLDSGYGSSEVARIERRLAKKRQAQEAWDRKQSAMEETVARTGFDQVRFGTPATNPAKKLGLPTRGLSNPTRRTYDAKVRTRYVPPKNWDGKLLQRGNERYVVDASGRRWVRGPSRTQDELFEWDVQPARGSTVLGRSHLNISVLGIPTHGH